MTQLIFIRHAMVEIDTTKPAHEWQLSANGRSACQLLAQTIAPHAPSRLFTSVEPKAAVTGQIVAEILGLPCQTAVNLHEHQRHTTPFFPDHAAFVAAVTRFFHQPDELVLGEETATAAQRRFVTAVQALMAKHPGQTLAIVTHGTVLTLFVHYYQPSLDPVAFWQALALPDAIVVDVP